MSYLTIALLGRFKYAMVRSRSFLELNTSYMSFQGLTLWCSSSSKSTNISICWQREKEYTERILVSRSRKHLRSGWWSQSL